MIKDTAALRRRRKAQLRDALIYWIYIPGAVLAGGKLADLLLPPLGGGAWPLWGGALLFAAGSGFICKATADLARLGEGTPNPQFPARRLVTGGSYAWCRHPMFFGYDLTAVGVALLVRSWGMLLVSIPVFLALQLRFLRREERYLEKRFAGKFRAYRRQVPLLVPRPPNRRLPS
ncbi:hypothetical protein DESUT3_34170 [Desulfuromonas versatilis]|uniref:Isoprenylcysteine carboxylmethyltransferase family protein n=1 Tax=Desulfuromonas versatilis TaxID=2802975 RepID=A0ABN6E1Y5_9BACT|nr:isoprenylcysteine carboxylmethyltransferase family protein [Desulfuromonas versatilis]BCR06348.1 hypothetical protein DESUT3_34170 [Desulfuromonas versatilis]